MSDLTRVKMKLILDILNKVDKHPAAEVASCVNKQLFANTSVKRFIGESYSMSASAARKCVKTL